VKPKREHATNTGQTYMVTTETWGRRSLFQAEPGLKPQSTMNSDGAAKAAPLQSKVETATMLKSKVKTA